MNEGVRLRYRCDICGWWGSERALPWHQDKTGHKLVSSVPSPLMTSTEKRRRRRARQAAAAVRAAGER